jgi:hypothetical protein
MEYRTTATYTHDERQNESRADSAEAMLAVGSDKLGEKEEERPSGVFTDVSDALAHFVHFCARAGLDFDEVVDKAVRAAQGDLEDGPEAARDTERFPEWAQ